MNKKILIISISSLFLLSIVFIIIADQAQFKKAELARKDTNYVLSKLKEMEPPEYEIKKAESAISSAEELYKKKKYKESLKKFTDASKNLLTLSDLKTKALLNTIVSYGHNYDKPEELIEKARLLKNQNLFTEAIDTYKLAYDSCQEIISKYKEEAEKNKPAINEDVSRLAIGGLLNRDYKVSNITIMMEGKWAVAEVTPLTFQTDPAYIALQEQNGSWTVIAGPGTSFEKSDYPQVPEQVLSYLNG